MVLVHGSEFNKNLSLGCKCAGAVSDQCLGPCWPELCFLFFHRQRLTFFFHFFFSLFSLLLSCRCILVIFGSMFFYFAVAYSEIFGRLPYWVKKVMCIKNKINLHDKADLGRRGSEPTMIFQQNPHMLAERDRLAAEAATIDITTRLAEQQEVMRREKLRAAAAIAQAQGNNKSKRSRGKKKKRAKKGFGAVKTDYGNTAADGMEIELAVVAAAKSDEKGREVAAPANNQKVWKRHTSIEGNTYYSDDKNHTVWTLPSGDTVE